MIEVLTDPKIWLLVLIMSVWGGVARLPNYYAGLRGKDTIVNLYPRIKAETWGNVIARYKRLGPTPLLIASIPIIGTLLTIGAGMARINRNSFIIFVIFSKIIRNWILVLLIWWLL
jgi:membrane protein YqaA with SNARE-associated domain